MDIPVINRIMEFETDMKSLQNPSIISQIFAVSNTFVKWSALIFALVASFTTIIGRIKILIIRLQTRPSLIQTHDVEYDSDSDSLSASSFSDEEETDDEEEEEATTSSPTDDVDFSVRGSRYQWQNGLRRRRRRSIGDLFSWSELASGKSVVKLWDNLGLKDVVRGADTGNLFAVYDVNCQREIRRIGSVFGAKLGIPAMVAASSSSSVVMSAAAEGDGRVEVRGWDTRVGSGLPALLAEWNVRDDGSGTLTVGDMRKVNVPLEDLTDRETDTWWDADAVVVTDEHFKDSMSS